MIEKIQLFFEVLMMPLSWMPDICLKLVVTIATAFAIFTLASFTSKVVNIFK